jgi:hypothetical protein
MQIRRFPGRLTPAATDREWQRAQPSFPDWTAALRAEPVGPRLELAERLIDAINNGAREIHQRRVNIA